MHISIVVTAHKEKMKQQYGFHTRIQNPQWSIIHIENLLELSRQNKNPSFIIYAAFESRNLLERIEFELIVMSANSIFGIEDFENIKKRHGIQKANKKFNVLKFRYQTFTESFTKVVKPGLGLQTYNYKESEKLKENLSQYLHLYSRTNKELEYESEFIQEGFNHINKSTEFLNSYFSIDTNSLYYGVLDFMTLAEPMKNEFKKWLNETEQKNEKLTKRLLEIVNINNKEPE